MAEAIQTSAAPSDIGAGKKWAGRLRLYSGLILMFYVTTHFLNHALGLRSLDALEAGQDVFLAFWRTAPMTLLLYFALIVHVALALNAIYRREKLSSMRTWEIVQALFGLLVPLILVQHIIGTRGMHELFALNDRYTFTLLVMWKFLPYFSWLQPITIFVIWIHGCIGIHFWLRLKPGYSKWRPYLFTAAILVPTLGVLGFIDAGLTVLALSENPEWMKNVMTTANAASPEEIAFTNQLIERARSSYIAAVVLTLVLRSFRLYRKRRSAGVSVSYDNGQSVQIARGVSVLDASRQLGLPHAAVCGGRGRCSTCRVRIGAGLEDVPPPEEGELKVLARVGAPPNVRLACQLRPTHALEVTRLLPPQSAGPNDAASKPGYLQGEEKEIAVLFADLRGFTKMSEHRLPYDVVFILNRYFSEMGQAVESSGGRLDKFIGDGVMALFGVERGAEAGAEMALKAAKAMSENLQTLNESLKGDLKEPLRIGIGIHIGPAIVGEMGYGRATGLTAVGDTVNTASRLETTTKEFGVQLVVSEAVGKSAGVDLSDYPAEEMPIRGRAEPVSIRLIEEARTLSV